MKVRQDIINVVILLIAGIGYLVALKIIERNSVQAQLSSLTHTSQMSI